MKTKHKVYSDQGLEYIIKVKITKKQTSYKMYRSNNDIWSTSCKGELVEHWVDTGNHFEGLDVDVRCTGYEKLDRLRLLLNFINKYDKNLFEEYIYKIKK